MFEMYDQDHPSWRHYCCIQSELQSVSDFLLPPFSIDQTNGYCSDDASAALFKYAGVELRKYDPNQCLHVPTGSAEQREALLPEVIAPTRS